MRIAVSECSRGGGSTTTRHLALVLLTALRCLSFFSIVVSPHAVAADVAPANHPAAQTSPPRSVWDWISANSPNAISGNPGAVNVKPGLGLLGRVLGFGPDSGVFIGALWSGDADYLFGGGVHPRSGDLNSLVVVGLDLDFEKLIGLPGSEFGATFLQFDGQASNADAGVVTGYDGLTGPPPLDRSELYQLWWRQRLFDDKLSVRFGKVVPHLRLQQRCQTCTRSGWKPIDSGGDRTHLHADLREPHHPGRTTGILQFGLWHNDHVYAGPKLVHFVRNL
jgi:carbohydrate-selective porin OprB